MGAAKEAFFLYCDYDVINGVFEDHHFFVVEEDGTRTSPESFAESSLIPFFCDGYGLINPEGDMVVPPEYDEIAYVKDMNPYGCDRNYLMVRQDDKVGIWTEGDQDPDKSVATSVKQVLPMEYDDIRYVFSQEGRPDAFVVMSHGKWGMIDMQNRVVLPFDYDRVFFPTGVCDVTGKPIDDGVRCSTFDPCSVVHHDFLCLAQNSEAGEHVFLLPLKNNPDARIRSWFLTEEPRWMYPAVGHSAVCFAESDDAIGLLDREGHWVIPLQAKDAFACVRRRFLRDRRQKSRKIEYAWRIARRIDRIEGIRCDQVKKLQKKLTYKFRRMNRRNRLHETRP